MEHSCFHALKCTHHRPTVGWSHCREHCCTSTTLDQFTYWPFGSILYSNIRIFIKLAVFTRLCTAQEITSRKSVNARVRVHTVNIGTKKLEFLSTDDFSSGMSTRSIAWPQVACWMKIGSECKQTRWLDFNTGWCEIQSDYLSYFLLLNTCWTAQMICWIYQQHHFSSSIPIATE